MPSHHDATGDKQRQSEPPGKTVLGLIVLTVLWAVTALIDGPLLVKLAFVGQKADAVIGDCTLDGGQTCVAKTVAPNAATNGATIEGRLRNSLLASYKTGTTIPVRLLDGDGTTMRSEGQIVRSAAMRLLAAMVLVSLWVRQWAKSKLTTPVGTPTSR